MQDAEQEGPGRGKELFRVTEEHVTEHTVLAIGKAPLTCLFCHGSRGRWEAGTGVVRYVKGCFNTRERA